MKQAKKMVGFDVNFKYVLALLVALYCLPVFAYDPMAPPGFDRSGTGFATDTKKLKTKSKTKSKSAGFVLRQIVIHPSNKSAVINGYIVNEGSYIKKALVKKINTNTVELVVLGKKKVLTLEARLPRIRR